MVPIVKDGDNIKETCAGDESARKVLLLKLNEEIPIAGAIVKDCVTIAEISHWSELIRQVL
jgi:hypothetical protein